MADPIRCKIVSPTGVLYEDEVFAIKGPGWEGGFGLLSRHAPYLVRLREGPLILKNADGAEAFRRIAEAEANLIDVQAIGPREVAHSLWQRAGIKPMGRWLLKDECRREREILSYAAERNAYLVKGRIPVVTGKLAPAPGMIILVEEDPAMRRPYVVLTAHPASSPEANLRGARLLSDFLLSEDVQSFLTRFDGGVGDGIPLFRPVARKQAVR